VDRVAKVAMVIATSILGLLAGSGPASAVVVAYGSHIGDFTFLSQGGTAVAVPIRNAATSVAFNLPTQATVSITFSAECAAAGPLISTGVQVDVLVDGVLIPPTTANDFFCAANATAAFDGWVRASTTVAAVLPAGAHTVSIQGSTFADAGWLGDTTILVER
jgi:hypothetical protein